MNTVDDLNKIRLSRDKLEKFLDHPNFKDIVIGCFVRISFGTSNGRAQYTAAEVVGVYESCEMYDVGNTKTNTALKLRYNAQEKIVRLIYISNKEFADCEYINLKFARASVGASMPTRAEIFKKIDHITKALGREFSEEEVQKIVKDKPRYQEAPRNYAFTKLKLSSAKEAALETGDNAAANRLNLRIEKLEEEAAQLDERRSNNISSIASINIRNRRKNMENMEKAVEEEGQREVQMDDPFTRRSTRPKLFNQTKNQAKPTFVPSFDAAAGASTKKPDPVEEIKKSQSADPFSAHDFSIDVDLGELIEENAINRLVEPITGRPLHVNRLATPVNKSDNSVPRRTLNLQEYKKKRGLI